MMETPRPTVLMFSGLGSQSYQMGRSLFARHGPFRDWMLRLDRLARPLAGRSMVDRIYGLSHPASEPFHGLLDSYLAIYMVEVAVTETLRTSGVTADCVLASSMGFFAAATVAGCLDPEEAMLALTAQARAIETHCAPGGMLAILGPVALYDDPAISSRCEIAGVSMPSHFVVAADLEGLSHVERHLRDRDVLYQRLAIDYAFHSRWIDAVREPLETLFAAVAGRPARIPIACCARASYVERLTADCIWTIARQPIRLSQTIDAIEARGPHFYVDAGPSGSLAGAVKSTLPRHSRSCVAPTLTPFNRDVENLEKIVGARPRTV
jgi:acyl transferase domain-containing protein